MKRLVSFGNRKLPRSTAIFNLCSATDCPSARRGMCPIINAGGTCYALKAERCYPQVLPYRQEQQKFWQSVDAERFVNSFMAWKGQREITHFRFSEAGDVSTAEDILQMDDIARRLSAEGITCYTYSARADLSDVWLATEDVVVNGSGWVADNEFRCIPKGAPKPKGAIKCKGDCRVCTLCSVATGRTIVNEYH